MPLFGVPLKSPFRLGMRAHTCNPSTWKAEARESQVGGQHGLPSKDLSQEKKRKKK
jgi:hypothetical protein